LARVCAPSLHDLLNQQAFHAELPLFAQAGVEGLESRMSESKTEEIIPQKLIAGLPERMRKSVDEAVSLYLFFEKKPGVNFAPVFTALLGVMDEAAKGLVLQKLQGSLPTNALVQKNWFEPYLGKVDSRMHRHYSELARNLRKTLVYQTGVSPLGQLRSCLDYALNDSTALTGVFEAVKEEFQIPGIRSLFDAVQKVNDFRNNHVAHQEKPLNKPADARAALVQWVQTLIALWAENSDTIYAKRCVVKLDQITPKEKSAGGISAEISASLPDVQLGPPGKLPTEYGQRLKNELTKQLQKTADFRFGANVAKVECIEVQSGSMHFTVAVTLAGAGMAFIRDCDKYRANIVIFINDIRRASGKIKQSVENLIGDPKNPFSVGDKNKKD